MHPVRRYRFYGDSWTLDLALDLAARPGATDLIARETECCSFFTFTLTAPANLRIAVPPAHTAVLDGLTARLPR